MKKYFHIIVYIAVLILSPVSAGAADINWVTESYRAATLANIDGDISDVGGKYGPPFPRVDEKNGPPFPVSSQAVALVPGEACAHGTSDITSSIMDVYAKACVFGGGDYTSNSYAEASFTGTFIAEDSLFLFDYSFSNSYHDNWITMTDLTDGTVINNVYFDGLDGTIEVPVYEGHTIEVEYGLSTSSFSDGYEEINETTMNYSMSIGCDAQPVLNDRTGLVYESFQAAYDDPQTADGDVIFSQAVVLRQNINLNRNISVTIDGGYDCAHSYVIGKTTIDGDVTINNGSSIYKDIIIN